MIYAPLVALAESAETEINLNCRSPHTLEVTPTFFTTQGEAFTGEPFQMRPTEVKTTKLKSLMPAAVRNRRYLGGMTLSYTGGMFEMWGQLRLMRVNHGNSVDVTFALSQDQRSSTRNAVWWMPTKSEAVIALGNFGSTVVKGKATFSDGDSEKVEVPAFGTQLIYLKSSDEQSASSGRGKAVTIEASESGSSLVVAGAVTSRDGTFTSSIRFYDPHFVAQPNLYATNFPLADVTPRLVLRNTGTGAVMTTPRFIPVSGDPNNFIDLPSASLGPGEIVNIDLDPLKNATADKPEFDHVSIQVLNSGTPGSLIGTLNGTDRRNKMTYDVPLRDIGGMRNSTGAYPWRVDQDLSTVVSITNIASVRSAVLAQINFSGGPYVLDPHQLAPGETVVYDLRKIRDEQIPDRNGHIIPRSVKHGQFKWSIYGPGAGRLIGRAEMLSQAEGISSSYSCPGGNCPIEFSYAFLDNPDPFLGPGDFANATAYEVDCDAYGCIGPFVASVNSWGQSDPFVALLVDNGSTANLVGISGGVTDFWANIGHDRWGWDGLNCYWLGFYIDNAYGQATVPSVKIKFNGNNVSGNQNVIVGQQISLTTETFPAGATVTNSQWTVPGDNTDRIANYVVNFTNNQSATSAVVTNLGSLTGASLTFYWVSGATRTVEYSVKVNNKTVHASATFAVQRPTVSMSAATNSSTNIAFDSVVQSLVLQLGSPTGTPGIVFTRSITTMPTGFNGDMQWVQVYNHFNGTVTFTGGSSSIHTCGLDDVYPYPLDPGATQTNLKTSDSPAVRLASGLTSASSDYNATMWLLFKPTGVTGTSIWVPLRKVTWAWAAAATFNGSSWTIGSHTDPSNLSSVDSLDHPTWNKNINFGQNCP